jgi:hypothetical protein
MKIEAIEETLQAKPFVPFRVVLPTERSVSVPHSEFVSVSPNRKWLLIWNKRGGWKVLDPALIVELSFNASRRH